MKKVICLTVCGILDCLTSGAYCMQPLAIDSVSESSHGQMSAIQAPADVRDLTLSADPLQQIRQRAESGDPKAQYELGKQLALIPDVDPMQTIDWWKKSADQGYAKAQYRLGDCYRYHIYHTGYSGDEGAMVMYKQAADQGYAKAQEALEEVFCCGLVRKLAADGEPTALCAMGMMYIAGIFKDKNYELALQWCEKAAEQGHHEAQSLVAAIKVWQQVRLEAESGDANAQYRFGKLHMNANGLKQNAELAFHWYREAAAQGHVNAQYEVANCYDRGIGVEKNYDLAIEWYEKAAEQGRHDAQLHANALNVWQRCRLEAENGDPEAQYMLGKLYNDTAGRNPSRELAFHWYSKAAEQGHVGAQYTVGEFYGFGLGIDRNSELAFHWYNKAAKQGYAVAQYRVADCYENGVGVEKNLELAIEWYLKSADNGNAKAQFNLGRLYQTGTGVEKNIYTAIEWYKKSADQGEYWGVKAHEQMLQAVEYQKKAEKGDAVAQYNLSQCYLEGCVKDDEMYVFWCTKSAENGYAEAQYSIGRHEHKESVNTPSRMNSALEWYRKAADQGYPPAQFHLGLCYYQGRGCEINYEMAVHWFRAAADRGFVAAIFDLGLCYEVGQGVEKNLDTAIQWYEKAAKMHYMEAMNALTRLADDYGNQQAIELLERQPNLRNKFYWICLKYGTLNE